MALGKSAESNSTVELLLKRVPSVHEHENCLQVLELFQNNKSLFALPVINDKNKPVGIVVRHDFIELFSKLYSKELKGNKPISTLMDESPIIVEKTTGIEDVARIILDAGIQHMVSGFIITDDKRYLGMANGYDLLNEITNRKQQHLFGLAHFDQLTGLPNRTLLIDRLQQSISLANRTTNSTSLLYIDLDGFKPINDTYGHAVGDKLLNEVGKRLRSCTRESDTAARMGGDEFVILLPDHDLEKATIVAKRILKKLRSPYEIGKKTITGVSASIGIAEYPKHSKDLDSLLTAADNAMYAAKKSGKDNFVIYT